MLNGKNEVRDGSDQRLQRYQDQIACGDPLDESRGLYWKSLAR
jgi:hypothetical protein